MNNLYRFFTLIALTMAWMMPAMAQHPFTLTTQAQHEAHSGEALYWIESYGATGFYMIPMGNGEDKGVSTSNMPNERMLWYFMDAGIENSTQYYYIFNKSTGEYLRLKGENGADGSIGIKATTSPDDSYKFSISGSAGQWIFSPKSGSNYYVNKKGSNVNYTSGLKSSGTNDANSKWNFVAKNSVTWAHPFTNSTNEEKHYYLIQNRHKDYTSFYMSTDASNYVTVSTVEDNNRIWYFVEASSDAQIPNMKYYYIVNAETDKYMYFDGTTLGNSLSDVFSIQDHSGGDDDRYQFAVVNAKGDKYSAFAIMPKKLISLYQDKYTSLGTSTMENGQHIGTLKDRGSNDNTAHWVFVDTEYFPVTVEAPTVTNNFDGTITLNTTTEGATIYYTTNGDDPDNTSTEYSSDFLLGEATVIKAIAYLGSEHSNVTPYNVPKYTTPTISFDDNTSLITITSEGTVYYNTGDGSQDNPTPSTGTPYSDPFIVSSDITVKAIATHPGYLTSDVATWSTIRGYLTFNVLTDGTICWKAFGDLTKTISYRINGGSWTDITSTSAGATINVNEGDVVEFKGSNETYATSKSAYSGFEGGTATFNIEGNIHSLLYGDNFTDNNSLTNSTYQFCSLFKKAKVKSAENLILPATTLKNYCYRALFSWCTTLEKAPVLPATTLATGCYWYMFEQCAIETAPDLTATTLLQECYGHMFEGCSNLNYIKCMATSGFGTSKCLENWVLNVASSGMFVKAESTTSWTSGESGIPTLWYLSNNTALYPPTISFDGETIELSCQTDEASIFYRFGNEDPYSLYTQPIAISENVVIDTYSTDGNQNSVVITQSCIYVHETPFEASNKTLSTWTYNGNVITTPYSVNRIDGHSSSYAKGTFSFETTVNLKTAQPTYLWFQHADQSATVYLDNQLVEKHWGGYNAFFVDISNYVHSGTNNLKVTLKNNEGNSLAPAGGDFNFNATLGNVKLFTSPVLPSMDYGYDGFHITATDVSSSAATLTIKTKVPLGATLICKIDDEGSNYHYSETESSTGGDQTFTTTIENPILWNGTINPHLYTVTLEIYKDGDLYHKFQRNYGIRFFEYVIDNDVPENSRFMLNGSPYLLRGVCMHDDLEGKANALNDDDYAQEFAIIQELGCNFIRLAHYPHSKEVYDWCDRLGIIVQTEVPCVNKLQSTLPQDYYDHLYIQYEDMVRQHYNHPCIVFWGLSNETTTDDKEFGKTKIEEYTSFIKGLDSERLVGYVMSHSVNDPSGYYNNPDVDWFGCNIYVGWYIDQNSNDPTSNLNTRLNNTLIREGIPLAFSEYGGGGTQSCHSDNFMTTTTRGNNPRHDIEYQMWLHEGHIAAIKNHPQLLFTSQWQLFDIAVYNRTEGYKVCLDGETVFDNNNLNRLNNKGLVERDHKTKKDPFYLYKAWWNPTDKFVHICGKDYEKRTDRAIKCYTNDEGPFYLYVNGTLENTKQASDNIVIFDTLDFPQGAVIRVDGATTSDTFTFTNTNVFKTDGNWNVAANWSAGEVPTTNSDVAIMAKATVPSGYTANADDINLYLYSSLTIADGGQLEHNNEGVVATVEKNITGYTVSQNQGELLTNGWYFIASPITDGYTPTGSMVANTYDLYRLDPTTTTWENFKNTTGHPDFTTLNNGAGYLYANSAQTTLSFTGTLKPYAASESVSVSTGWNLIGNPFAYNVYANRSFYMMNEAKTGVEAVSAFSTSPIAPCTGIVVEAETDDNVIFSKEAPKQSQGSNGSLLITLSQANTRDNALLDNAIVSFNEDSYLGKFYFGTPNANIYIPQNGKEYAIVSANAKGEMPINFKAFENGTYTLTVKAEDVEMGYLHLIDNITGTDIDLLSTPNYTFSAMNDDYASRFRLVFSANMNENDNENFAFFSNGSLIITNEGEATLQVIDITGRVISSETINSTFSKSLNAANGVYVLRLVNGNNVRTQKIVID